jgi:hypothetical protein
VTSAPAGKEISRSRIRGLLTKNWRPAHVWPWLSLFRWQISRFARHLNPIFCTFLAALAIKEPGMACNEDVQRPSYPQVLFGGAITVFPLPSNCRRWDTATTASITAATNFEGSTLIGVSETPSSGNTVQ